MQSSLCVFVFYELMCHSNGYIFFSYCSIVVVRFRGDFPFSSSLNFATPVFYCDIITPESGQKTNHSKGDHFLKRWMWKKILNCDLTNMAAVRESLTIEFRATKFFSQIAHPLMKYSTLKSRGGGSASRRQAARRKRVRSQPAIPFSRKSRKVRIIKRLFF